MLQHVVLCRFETQTNMLLVRPQSYRWCLYVVKIVWYIGGVHETVSCTLQNSITPSEPCQAVCTFDVFHMRPQVFIFNFRSMFGEYGLGEKIACICEFCFDSSAAASNGIQEGGRVQGWESVCWGGFKDIDFPRCTIIFQDLKDSGLVIFQDALIFKKMIFPTVPRFQDSSNSIQTVSKVLKNMLVLVVFIELSRLSEIIQDS